MEKKPIDWLREGYEQSEKEQESEGSRE